MERQPTLADGVISLTPFSLRDVRPLLDANRDPEMALRFDFPPGSPDPEAARAAIRRWQRGWRTRRLVAFAVRDVSSLRLVGGCEVRVEADGIANVSYFTVPAERGRGIATRATQLVSAFALRRLDVERLEIKVETDNRASRAVAEAAGFTFEGILRGAGAYRRGRRDVALFSRLRSDEIGASG